MQAAVWSIAATVCWKLGSACYPTNPDLRPGTNHRHEGDYKAPSQTHGSQSKTDLCFDETSL